MPAAASATPRLFAGPSDGPAPRDAWTTWRIPLLLAVVAVAIRLSTVVRGGGLFGYYGYDDGVYYSAAASFVFGRLPYRDFVLLHPPGILLALSPFAELARFTSDRDAMALARVAALLLGGVNTFLTARVAAVLGRGAAVAAGGLTAVWVHAAYVDRVPLLEPLGSLLLLSALLLLRPHRRRHPRLGARHAEVLAGVALGLSASVKIWAVVSLAVVGVALLATRGPRAAARMVGGAAAAGIVVCGPFLLAAPGAMVRMVVLDQTGRPEVGPSLTRRPPLLLGIDGYLGSLGRPTVVATATVVVAGLLLALLVAALREPVARPWVALLVAHALVLLAAPVYFTHYAAFLTVPLSLVVGGGVAVLARSLRDRPDRGRLGRHRPRLLRRGLALAGVALLAAAGVATASFSWGARYPGRQLAAHLPGDGCVQADDAGALIQLDVLSRDLARGCRLDVDFTGRTYDRLARTGPDGRRLSRGRNADWQRYARGYLTSGTATVLVRGRGNGFSRTTRAQLATLPVLAQVGPWQVLGPGRRQQ